MYPSPTLLNLLIGSEHYYDDNYGNNEQHHAPPNPNPPSSLSAEKFKEIGLKDITDIALTTLAFLSFGIFILQVLMCVVLTKDDTSNLAIQPMEDLDNGEIPDYDSVDELRRTSRSVKIDKPYQIVLMNKLAHRALFSLQALTFPRTDGYCYYYLMCENNKFAKQQESDQQFWVPTWSLGISWAAERLSSGMTKDFVGYQPIMQSLKAIVIGLSKGDCLAYFRNNSKIATC